MHILELYNFENGIGGPKLLYQAVVGMKNDDVYRG